MKTNFFKYLISIVMFLFVLSGVAHAQNSSLWYLSGTLIRPILSTWDIYAPDELRFDGEIQPDGSTCANGEILKKTGANDWDCAADDGGSGASTALDNLASVAINTTLVSDTDNTDALGTTAIAWSDL